MTAEAPRPANPPAPATATSTPRDSDLVFDDVHLTDPGLDTIPHPFWRSWKASFEAAVAGVLRTVATQRNMKVHTTAAMMVMLVGMALPLNLATRSALVFLIAAVMFAEILNTALEAVVDLFIGTYHRLAMLTKDAAAAGVLILAVGAVVIFFDILIANWRMVADNLDRVILYAGLGVPVVVLQLVVLFGPRKGVLPWLLTVVGLALLVPLIGLSLDPLFSAGSVLVLLSSRIARARFSGRMPRGAPRGPASHDG
ncbi:MAG: diacylglycerol kinase family protein [Pseudomonadota bacterium]